MAEDDLIKVAWERIIESRPDVVPGEKELRTNGYFLQRIFRKIK